MKKGKEWKPRPVRDLLKDREELKGLFLSNFNFSCKGCNRLPPEKRGE